MDGLTSSLIIGFLLGSSLGWLIWHLNHRYTQWEKTISRILFKRGKKN
jgi:hypothetical protein